MKGSTIIEFENYYTNLAHKLSNSFKIVLLYNTEQLLTQLLTEIYHTDLSINSNNI